MYSHDPPQIKFTMLVVTFVLMLNKPYFFLNAGIIVKDSALKLFGRSQDKQFELKLKTKTK